MGRLKSWNGWNNNPYNKGDLLIADDIGQNGAVRPGMACFGRVRYDTVRIRKIKKDNVIKMYWTIDIDILEKYQIVKNEHD